MYRENPQFIVAGEIVRTSRMYAMSVSPLDRNLLSRINPDLVTKLSRHGKDGGGARGRKEESVSAGSKAQGEEDGARVD